MVRKGRRLAILFALWGCGLTPARAADDPWHLCEAAAATAASESGVPLALLRAVMTTESGRAPDGRHGTPRAAWPWTVQAAGRGHWLSARAEALALAEDILAGGNRNLDLGCFQINVRWHGAAFPGPEAMLDPLANARYAAAYLTDLRRETGDWRAAAGAYHSRDPGRAEEYVARLIAAHGAGGRDAPVAPDASDEAGDAAVGTDIAQGDTPRPTRAAFSLTGARGPLVGPRTTREPLIGPGG